MLIEDAGKIFVSGIRINASNFAVDCSIGETAIIVHKNLFIRGHIKRIVAFFIKPCVNRDRNNVVFVIVLDLVESNDTARTPATFCAGPLFDNVHSLHAAIKGYNGNRGYVVFCSAVIAAVHLCNRKCTIVNALAVGLNCRNSHSLCAEVAERSGKINRTAGCVAVYLVSVVERGDIRHTIVAHVSTELLVSTRNFAAQAISTDNGQVVVLTTSRAVGEALNVVCCVAVFVEHLRGVNPTTVVEISTTINRGGVYARCYGITLNGRRLNVCRVTYHNRLARDGVRILASDDVSIKFNEAASLLPNNLARGQAHHPNRAVGERTGGSVESNLVDRVANILLHQILSESHTPAQFRCRGRHVDKALERGHRVCPAPEIEDFRLIDFALARLDLLLLRSSNETLLEVAERIYSLCLKQEVGQLLLFNLCTYLRLGKSLRLCACRHSNHYGSNQK